MTNTKTEKITFHFSLGSWLPIWRLVVHFDFSFFPRELITNLTPCCSFWLLIFPSGADYQSDALLFIFPKVQMCKCDDMTFSQMCKCANVTTWHFPKCANVQMCKCANVTTWHFFSAMPLSHCHGQNIFMQSGQCIFSLPWPKYFSIAFPNVPRRSLSSWYQQSTVAHVLKWWGLTSLYILSLFDATSVTMHLLICW